MILKDKDFLKWIHDRLIHVHGESPNVDYIHMLRSIIDTIPENQITPNTGSEDYLVDKGRWKKEPKLY